MKLALCILAFERAIKASNRPEDRLLGSNYLSVLGPLLAQVIEKQKIQSRIADIDRLFSQTWIINSEPFEEAFDLWKCVKQDLLNQE